jgi:2-keto-4-pentenoate hydratase/2-oxohepta-3-ene-1,7-dioic acid hydratase in catechol pathway
VTRAGFVRVLAGGASRWAREREDGLHLLDGPPWETPREDATVLAAEAAPLLAPVAPSKIVAIGRNYRAHAAERGKPVPREPLLFLKPPSSIVGPGADIRRPAWAGRVDHEAEVGVVIGTEAVDLPGPETALRHVFGVTCVNDVTARDLQEKDVQFTRAKGFDTFCPVGPRLVSGLDPGRLGVLGRVNGEVRQSGTTADLIFDVAYLVWFVSRVMTLLPGDIISTGTPSGVGPLLPGDVVEVEVEGVGVLRNRVVER